MTGRDAPPASAADGAPASTPAQAPAARGGWRAWAELLRAPLLLSPIADVLAGWCIGVAGASLQADPDMPRDAAFAETALVVAGPLACAAVAGTCLLAAGMAQNALADQADDALRKPGRPLPRGALTRREVWIAWALLTITGLALAAAVSARALAVAGLIVALTALYHFVFKRFRLAGCVNLGLLRGCDLALGTCVALVWMGSAGGARSLDWPVHYEPMLPTTVAILYALLMTGASLHASTDDEPETRASRWWSDAGIGMHMAAFAALAVLMVPSGFRHGPLLVVSVSLPVGAIQRVWTSSRRLPPGPLTGVLLSGLYLFDATVCLTHHTWWLALGCAGLVLALFAASRSMKRAFPPT